MDIQPHDSSPCLVRAASLAFQNSKCQGDRETTRQPWFDLQRNCNQAWPVIVIPQWQEERNDFWTPSSPKPQNRNLPVHGPYSTLRHLNPGTVFIMTSWDNVPSCPRIPALTIQAATLSTWCLRELLQIALGFGHKWIWNYHNVYGLCPAQQHLRQKSKPKEASKGQEMDRVCIYQSTSMPAGRRSRGWSSRIPQNFLRTISSLYFLLWHAYLSFSSPSPGKFWGPPWIIK